MSVVSFFNEYDKVINGLSSIFTAFETVGTVITALYLSVRDSKPKLKVYCTVAVTFPANSEHLWISCTNIGKQPIVCNEFSFAPTLSKPLRILPLNCIESLSTPVPCMLNYSEKLDRHFDQVFFSDRNLARILSKHEWLAKIELKLFWRVIANTNVGVFSGKLSSDVIEKILQLQFPSKKP